MSTQGVESQEQMVKWNRAPSSFVASKDAFGVLSLAALGRIASSWKGKKLGHKKAVCLDMQDAKEISDGHINVPKNLKVYEDYGQKWANGLAELLVSANDEREKNDGDLSYKQIKLF